MSKAIIEVGKQKLHITKTRVFWEGSELNEGLDHPTLIQTNIQYYAWYNPFKKFRYYIKLKNASNDLLEISYVEGLWPFGTRQGLPLFNHLTDQLYHLIFFERWEELQQQWREGHTIRIGDFEIDQEKFVKTQGNNRKTMAFKDMHIYDSLSFQLLVDQSNNDNTIVNHRHLDWNSLPIEAIFYEKKIPVEPVEQVSALAQYIGDEPWYKQLPEIAYEQSPFLNK
mgnify:CR=1 FL=1